MVSKKNAKHYDDVTKLFETNMTSKYLERRSSSDNILKMRREPDPNKKEKDQKRKKEEFRIDSSKSFFRNVVEMLRVGKGQKNMEEIAN